MKLLKSLTAARRVCGDCIDGVTVNRLQSGNVFIYFLWWYK